MAIYYGIGIKRDFSDEAREKLIQAIKDVNESQWSEVTDYIGDYIQRINDSMVLEGAGMQCDIDGELLNAQEYYEKIVDKNNSTEKEINQIFDDVISEDKNGKVRFEGIYSCIKKQTEYIQNLADIMNPDNHKFQVEQMVKELKVSYQAVLEKAGAVMGSMLETGSTVGENLLAGELLIMLAGENPVWYAEYADMSETEREHYIQSIATVMQELIPYLNLGAHFNRIEIPIGGDCYAYYELEVSKDFKEEDMENMPELQMLLSNQLESMISYTFSTDDGSVEIGTEGLEVEIEQGEGNVRSSLGINSEGGVSAGIIYEYDEGTVTISSGTELGEKEVYIEAESETENLGTVTSTIGIGQGENNKPAELSDWEADVIERLEESLFTDNPFDYVFYFPTPSPIPVFW